MKSTVQRLIEEYFQNRACEICGRFFKPEAVKLVKETGEHAIAKVTCTICGKSLGTAIIGIRSEE